MPPITPNIVLPPQAVGLTSIELKAISVPQSLLFLLSIEYDMFLCITTSGIKKPFTLTLNQKLAPTYRFLLENGAKRFGLSVVHGESSSTIVSDGTSGKMPLLRYVDYIPGSLHVDELLDCFGVNTKALPRQAKPLANNNDGTASYEACFTDYSPYSNDDAFHDVHGCGFYLTLDMGLSLATHSHLLQVTFREDPIASSAGKKNGRAVSPPAAANGSAYAASLAAFLKFSGWEKLDLRFEDESKKYAVIVLPSTQDANDLLEKYENEESDNEVDDMADATIATAAAFRVPFHIRPIASTVSVPYIEDSVLRKLRAQHWPKIEAFWNTKCAVSKNTIAISNLYEGVTLEEVLKLFNGSVISASMAEDESPQKRRRVFVTFATSDDTKDALTLDGKNTHGKSLKIHAAPPYVDISRRGKIIATKGMGITALLSKKGSISVSASPAGGEQLKTPGGLNAAAKEFVPKFAMGPPTPSNATPVGGIGMNGSFSLPPPYTGGGSPLAAGAAAIPPPPAYGGVSPIAGAALPPAYGGPVGAPAISPIGGTNPAFPAAGGSCAPPSYSLPPPYAPGAAGTSSPSMGSAKPLPPPPAYVPSPVNKTPATPVS